MKYLVWKTSDDRGCVEFDTVGMQIAQDKLGDDFIKHVKILEGSEIATAVFRPTKCIVGIGKDDEIRPVIIEALEEAKWVQEDAGELLGLSPRAMNYRVNKLGITHKSWPRNHPDKMTLIRSKVS